MGELQGKEAVRQRTKLGIGKGSAALYVSAEPAGITVK